MLGAFRLRVFLVVAAVCLFRESLMAADTSLPEPGFLLPSQWLGTER
jgi:hypothetical protein